MKQIQQLDRTELGRWGEQVASQYLSGKGWAILDRNWAARGGELDIVGFDPARQAVVAVEVKTRRGRGTGLPQEAVTPPKVKRIRGLLLSWIINRRAYSANLAVDVVGIWVLPTGEFTVEHLEGVEP